MKISASNNIQQNFGANMPIWKVFNRLKNGEIVELSSSKIRGPVQALVTRLNDCYSREAGFFRDTLKIKDFIDYPLATSSIVGRNDIKKKHILFGKDAFLANFNREDCHRKGNCTMEEVRDIIHKSLIAPFDKKVKMQMAGEKLEEQVGLVLYTDEVRAGYNKLNGIKVTSIDGKREYGELPALITKKSRKAVVNEQTTSTVSENIAKQSNSSEEQAFLFDTTDYISKKTPWDSDFHKKGKR